jgi:hypothetical protein
MTCLKERVAGAMFLLLSGYAFADGAIADSSETMTVANIAPMPADSLPPIPEPERYLSPYAMEYRSIPEAPFNAGLTDFYSAQVPDRFRFDTGQAGLAPKSAPKQLSPAFLNTGGPSTSPQISIVQLPDPAFEIGAQPQRKLSLIVNDWGFSATARVALLHSHQTGLTLSVRHGF